MSRRSPKTRKHQESRRPAWSTWLNKWTLGGAALILVGLLGFLLAANRSSPAPASSTGASNQADIPHPGVPRMSLEEVKAKSDAGTVLIVDSRSAEAYARSHIPGATSLPLSDLSTQNPDLPRDREIITYCT
ncbi:MAG: hypothetical protein MAG451_02760 [Anaerolineales bacterium]|nr:hypothetical protein [Anaerolineales bacterium]